MDEESNSEMNEEGEEGEEEKLFSLKKWIPSSMHIELTAWPSLLEGWSSVL